LLERVVELVGLQDRGEVEQGPRHAGDRDAGVDGALVVGDVPFVRPDARPRPQPPRQGHIDPGRRVVADAEQSSRGSMAEQRIRTAGQHSRKPNAPLRDPSPTHRIDPPEDDVQPLRLHATIDRMPPEPKSKQLPPRDDAVLAIRERGDLRIGPHRPRAPGASFAAHIRVHGAFAPHSPIVAVVLRRVGR
jgi:hypothetical protein